MHHNRGVRTSGWSGPGIDWIQKEERLIGKTEFMVAAQRKVELLLEHVQKKTKRGGRKRLWGNWQRWKWELLRKNQPTLKIGGAVSVDWVNGKER